MSKEEKLIQKGNFAYQLMHAGWRKGEEQFKNRLSFQVYADKDAGETDEDITRRLVACWNACDGLPQDDLDELAEMPNAVMNLARFSYDLVKERDELVNMLRAVTDFAYRQICQHEDTHRGGSIWEICDSCGAKWADDEGGKPETSEPEPIKSALDILSKYPEAS